MRLRQSGELWLKLAHARLPGAAVCRRDHEDGRPRRAAQLHLRLQIQANAGAGAGTPRNAGAGDRSSGGLSATYLAELVGEDGEVITVDIDSEATARARRLLDVHDYSWVHVVTVGAGLDLGEVDGVMVTVGA
ncbi:hypothetical protein ACFV16_30730 [Streptomyces massasporeus]|uniref:hypothetical protein n=1 Tax=Streptomyces massasporeus TaxID=67324 RepID=UPI00369BDA7F